MFSFNVLYTGTGFCLWGPEAKNVGACVDMGSLLKYFQVSFHGKLYFHAGLLID